MERRIYKSDAEPWVPGILEIGLNPETPMTVVAVYKIIRAYMNAA
jgi:hypothetical protein